MVRRILSFIVLATFLAACGGPAKEGAPKKVFRYNQTGGLKSLDPAFANNRATVWATTQLYNGLFEMDESLHPMPALANTWSISEDGKTYTFTIKKGVYFHDDPCFPDGKGREVKASDFVYSFKRIMSPATASTGRWVFEGKVLTNPNGTLSDSAFVALDDYTLQIRLKEPFPPFIDLLTVPYTFVVPREAVEYYKDDFRSHPVGTGPFKFKEWKEGESLVFEKNPNYWKAKELGKDIPYVDAVQVRFIEDPNQAFREFQAGNLDFITGLPENAKEILDGQGNIKPEFAQKFNIEKADYLNTEYIGFQMNPENYVDPDKHPFLKKEFRQALAYAIDRDELVYSLRNGLGKPGVAGIVPMGMPSFDSSVVKGYRYDPAKARELLKQAGYPNGQGLEKYELKLSTYSTDRNIAEFIQKQWESIGVKVEIETAQFSTHQERVDNGKVNLFRGSWLADYPDAENYLAMFYSKYLSPAGPNKTHFINPTYDSLYVEAMHVKENAEDYFKRYAIYHEMEKLILEECPVIILYYDDVLRMSQKNVTGLRVNPMNILSLEEVDFVDPNQAAAETAGTE
ncbi:ABC transporter substrate-binding protein [Thermonema rossianum]|uniref:ABC transporter substrate-binding protein n=1 Tax=Thermonema rossianum TaxID=55505 RepID=UPI00056FD49B|nr:ABC transporter substrate-binding protein [Thermonema rossianum]